MADVMLSIRPFWCAEIANGYKTIEVRKTRPKQEAPFRCYIYCTNTGRPLVYGDIPDIGGWRELYTQTFGYSREAAERIWEVMNGKVIGEFVCDKIYTIEAIGPLPWGGSKGSWSPINPNDACLTVNEIEDYIDGRDGFGWHISNLQIYGEGELRALSDFGLKRPPQSWCYVKEII